MEIIAEIGINHNGNLELAKMLINAATLAGCTGVKFQKRTVEKVYTKEELDKPRESPWGTTNREQKNGLEFGETEYNAIDEHCKQNNIKWFASPWDIDSIEFLLQYNPPYIKVASALVTDLEFIDAIRETNIPVILSTGMSSKWEVCKAVDILGDNIEFLLACCSAYPCKPEESKLEMINILRYEFPQYRIGYSNHSSGLTFCIGAAAFGAEMIEFHITLDRSMYGSDQSSSIELPGMISLVKHIRDIEASRECKIWKVFDSEKIIREKLRKNNGNN